MGHSEHSPVLAHRRSLASFRDALGPLVHIQCLLLIALTALSRQMRLEWETFRQQVVADVGAADRQVLQLLRLFALLLQLDLLEVCVHRHVDGSDRASHDRAVFQLDRHRLIAQFHEKLNQLHILLNLKYQLY